MELDHCFCRKATQGSSLLLALTLSLTAWALPWQPSLRTHSAQQSPSRAESPAPAAVLTPEQAKARPNLDKFADHVDAILAAPQAEKAMWGVEVVDADTGAIFYSRNSDRYFTPASNAKLFATAFAMATLGPNYRFRTTIETRGALDPAGVLDGNLVLVGRGDPDLSNRKFPYDPTAESEGPPDKVLAEMADAVVAKGLKEIKGDVVADDSYFTDEPYPPGWAIDDMIYDFGAPVSAIAINDNTLDVLVSPADRSDRLASYDVEPWPAFYTLVNEITTGPPHSDPKFDYFWQPGSPRVELRGSVPLGYAPQTLAVAIREPAEYAAALLEHLLEARGVKVDGKVRAQHASVPGADPATKEVLAEHLSLPLAELLVPVNKLSLNLHAEMLLRTIAQVVRGTGSLEVGLQIEQQFINSVGIANGDVFLTDASGLSRTDLVTPRTVVTLLQFVAQQPWGKQFIASLPAAGVDGTLQDRMRNTPAAGRVIAKTGSLEHTRAISGFATTLSGEHLIFSIFGNHYTMNGHDAAAVLDQICEAMVEEIGEAPGRQP